MPIQFDLSKEYSKEGLKVEIYRMFNDGLNVDQVVEVLQGKATKSSVAGCYRWWSRNKDVKNSQKAEGKAKEESENENKKSDTTLIEKKQSEYHKANVEALKACSMIKEGIKTLIDLHSKYTTKFLIEEEFRFNLLRNTLIHDIENKGDYEENRGDNLVNISKARRNFKNLKSILTLFGKNQQQYEKIYKIFENEINTNRTKEQMEEIDFDGTLGFLLNNIHEKKYINKEFTELLIETIGIERVGKIKVLQQFLNEEECNNEQETSL